MSILIVGEEPELLKALTRRLVAEGDEVRMVGSKQSPDLAGVYVARGELDDEDLIERAAQNCRTVIVLDPRGEIGPETTAAILGGARRARVERIVACGPADAPAVRATAVLEGEFIVLEVERPRRLRRPRFDPERLAEAIDAADDIAGPMRATLSLSEAASWIKLGLDPP